MTFAIEILENLIKSFKPLLQKIDCLDLVEITSFKDKANELKRKITSLNEMLCILSEHEIPELTNEINELQESSLDWEKSLAKKSSLYLF